MRKTTIAERYVRAGRREAAAMLSGRFELGAITAIATGSWEPVPWMGHVEAWRQHAVWRRGRATGDLIVDLVDAGPELSLLGIALEHPGVPLALGVPARQVHGLADRLCRLVEQRRTASTMSVEDKTVAPEPAVVIPLAVGYFES